MVMSKTVRWHGLQMTKGDLLEFLGEISSAPDETLISVDKAPYGGSPADPGGEITLQAELPRERRSSSGMVPGR